MEFHGKCPNPPCKYFPWKSMEKFPWNSMEIDVLILHEIPWRIFHGNPWNSMEFHGGFSHGHLCQAFLSFSSLPFSLPSFPFSPETPDTQASKNVIWSINCKGKESFRYELKQWNCKNIAITWCIVIAREQEKQMSRNIGCTSRLNQFVSERDVSPGVSKLLCIKTTGMQTLPINKIQNSSW